MDEGQEVELRKNKGGQHPLLEDLAIPTQRERIDAKMIRTMNKENVKMMGGRIRGKEDKC